MFVFDIGNDVAFTSGLCLHKILACFLIISAHNWSSNSTCVLHGFKDSIHVLLVASCGAG